MVYCLSSAYMLGSLLPALIMKVILFLSLLFFGGFTFAQTPFSLKDCIEYAEQHSSEIKLSQEQSKSADLNHKQSRNSYLPSLSISNQNNLSTGRVLDRTTYQKIANPVQPAGSRRLVRRLQQ